LFKFSIFFRRTVHRAADVSSDHWLWLHRRNWNSDDWAENKRKTYWILMC